MFTETQLHFFKEKITAVETALLINQSDSVLRLPNRVVRASHIDDFGQLWILVPRPMQHLSEFETTFPVKLQFARKGAPCSIQIEGRAHMITDRESLSELGYLPKEIKEKAVAEQLLLKLNVRKVHFKLAKPRQTPSLLQSWSTSYHRLLETQRMIFNQLLVKLHF
jgi:hypothetical protein